MEQRELYEGTVKLNFNPVTHRYEVEEKGCSQSVPSVTTILKVIDKGDALIQWAANSTSAYIRQHLGTLEEIDRQQLEQVIDDARFNYRALSKQATDIGTQAHNWIEAHSNHQAPSLPEDERAANCVNAYLKWKDEHRVEVVESERFIFSRKHFYCGCLDQIALVEGRPAVLDFKSSKGFYAEYALQTAAYVAAYAEETGEQIKDRYIVRLGKEDGQFEVRKYEQQRTDFAAFRAALTLWRRLKELK